jgi:hypothetical protein
LPNVGTGTCQDASNLFWVSLLPNVSTYICQDASNLCWVSVLCYHV